MAGIHANVGRNALPGLVPLTGNRPRNIRRRVDVGRPLVGKQLAVVSRDVGQVCLVHQLK